MPHVSIGSPVHIAASLHCASVIPNFSVTEYWIGENPLSVIAMDIPVPTAGRLAAQDAPGLGITVDEAAVAALDKAPG